MKVNKRFGMILLVFVLAIGIVFGGNFAYKEYQNERVAKALMENQRFVKGDPDAPSSEQATVGNGNEAGLDPDSAAEEAFANRAYPADDIPFQLTLNAQAAFNQIKAQGVGRGKNVPGQWTLAGPSTANYPSVLTFSGADYTTSGRITGLAIAPDCNNNSCRLWVGAAGGGVWRTDNALSGSGAKWTFVSGSFATNAIGVLYYDAANNTLYAGTGESHASGDSEAGMGIYTSTDGGDTWTHLSSTVTSLTTPGNGTYTGDAFAGRSISSIVVDPSDPNIIYVGSTRGVRGVSSVTGGATSNPPTPRPPFGLFKSTDGGATFTFIWDGNASQRGVSRVKLDPINSQVVYASAYQQGIWRSANGSASFEQIFFPTSFLLNTDRTEFDVNVKNGHTRIYAGDGAQGDFGQAGATYSQFFRADDVDTKSAADLVGASDNSGWVSLTSADPANPHYATYEYCTGQCWYDQYVFTPAGYPDIVYLGGSYQYGEYGWMSNSRGALLSTDAGETFTDMSWDASSDSTPNGLHPDHHVLVTNPNDPYTFFDGSDGGLVRSSGDFKDVSYQCDQRGVFEPYLTACRQLLSRVPKHLFSLNKGLSTLQFQSLSVNAANPKNLMGGTQDNGTFETTGSAVTWPQIIYGDGGQSGFNVADPALRFNSFFGQYHDANFQNGDPTKWVIISGPIVSSDESSAFYAPIIADPNPAAAGTIFEGSQSVWRTQDWGGDQAYLEANCPEFTTSGADPNCGDFVRIGPAGATNLTVDAGDYRGTGRTGGTLAAVERTPVDTGTLWVATSTGRVFISKNADADAGSVTYTRLDTLATNDPGRFVSSIYIDQSNPNHAWISYSGYNFNTPAQPGHVFEVTFDPGAGTAVWTDLSYNVGDLPATGLVRDDVSGDLYASSDFGVMRLPSGETSWVLSGTGLPNVEVAGLTIVPDARVLYAATHGRSAWMLRLP
ncbi:MAG: WD40/YVTN/BNR-like repeat-containing protein [Anaerolineales bacterium]